MSSVDFINEHISWKDITPAGNVYEGGTAEGFRTGDWRINIPEYIAEKCKQCFFARLYVPTHQYQ